MVPRGRSVSVSGGKGTGFDDEVREITESTLSKVPKSIRGVTGGQPS